MKFLQFNSIGGASGDMILAALIDLGISRDELQNSLAGLHVEEFDIQVSSFSANAMNGLQVKVHIEPHPHVPHGKHSHSLHRGLKEIRTLVLNSVLPDRVKETSMSVFQRLAQAEAHVHGTTPDKIHFHEVGAVDSIIDIVGSCLAVDLLCVDGIAVGTLPLGHGVTECDHGTLPVPVPATVEILKGIPVFQTEEPFELVTPTGAALLSTLKTMDRPLSGSRIVGTGHGFGHRTLDNRPNLLRSFLMEFTENNVSTDECLVLECNVDDTIPELLGYLSLQLMQAGALDAFMTPVQMKKQRPGILLTVLCRPELRDELLDLIFRESTTFGIREYPVKRTVLQRRSESVKTRYGNVNVKTGLWKGSVITRTPEYTDCVRLAQQAGISVRAVYEAAIQAASNSEYNRRL